MAQQLSFELPSRTALGRDDFFVSPANAAAVAMIEGWQEWPTRKLMLIGPRGAGKTHLAHVWAALSDATVVAANRLLNEDIPDLSKQSLAIEDCEDIAGNKPAEEALFHLHNLALAEGRSLLFTSTDAPAAQQFALPDLSSRLQSAPSVHITPPDDTLLGAVMMKLFADRQLSPTPATLPYLIKRIDRSFAAAHEIVDALDSTSLESRRSITPRLASEVLDKHSV